MTSKHFTAAPSLVLKNVYAGYSSQPSPVLLNACLELFPGECVALLGSNGAGKSTLLKVAAGLLNPINGTVQVFGKMAVPGTSDVAYVAQTGTVDWNYPICVECFVLMGRYVHLNWMQRPRRRDREIAASALETLDLNDLAGRRISDLSGGQRQRVLLARALAQEARLFLLDEPLNAVDSSTRESFVLTLSRLRQSGGTILMATHDTDGLADALDSSIRISGGALDRSAA